MITLTRILVPHDFSETSEAAVAFASGLAETFHAALDVLHVNEVDTDMLAEYADGRHAGPAEAIRQRLMKSVIRDEKTTQLGAEFHVRPGTPYVEISRFAKDRTIDLIVMGTHGRGFVGHTIMGSVAEKVVRTAPCPVLTLRGPQRESLVPNILVALDFEPASDTALTYGRALGRMFGARLHVLHVMDNDFLRPMFSDPHVLAARASQQVSDRLTDEDRTALHATAVVEMSDTPADTIVEYATKAPIDLIIVGTHGRRAFDRFLIGSVAERVVRTAPCPVLTVRHPEREFVELDSAPTAVPTPTRE
jgi:nucleotide-binding universal stress UspA family protein